MNNRVATFGARVLRLKISGYARFVQVKSYQVIYGIGEANVKVHPVNYDVLVNFIFRLSENGIGDVLKGEANDDGSEFDCRQLYNRFSKVKKIIITMSGFVNANHNTGQLY
jgi:hypothetical protein